MDATPVQRRDMGPSVKVAIIIPVLSCLLPAILHAQVARGVVRDAASGTPIPGVVVTLARDTSAAAAQRAVSALTNDRGEFAIRGSEAGRYRLAAKRIGVKRTETEPFDLGTGETRQFTIDIEPLLYVLPEVSVATATFCIPKREEVGQVASLWEEIRTALTATSISVRDSLYKGRIVSFGRLLDGRGRVLSESSHHFDGLLKETFAGAHPESLSTRGYWNQDADSVRFNAMDVDVLLSPSFLRDHCFELGEETNGERGLRFQPVPRRPVTDVRGTVWVDARSFELRRLEFTYTHLPRVERVEGIGGEVHFARLASGAWVVRRWALRVPQFVGGQTYSRSFDRANPISSRLDINRTVPNRVVENGGIAYIDHLRTYEQPALVRGVVRDSTGALLTGGTVRLAGTQYLDSLDAAGRFQLDSIPPGLYRIEAVAPSTASLGVAIADEEVTVRAGEDLTMALNGSGLDGILGRLCDGRAVARDRTAMKVVLIDSTTDLPLVGAPLRLWWTEYIRDRGMRRVVNQQLDARTAVDGSAVFCGLPMNVQLDFGLAIGDDRARRLESFTLPSRVPTVRLVRQE